MLHIAIGTSEESLLRESNQFPQDDFMDFCLILSYGNIKNIEQKEYKEMPVLNYWKINIKEKIKELEEKIKNNKDVRIWYSKLDNEDICNTYFLIYYLSKYNDINIYLSEIGREWGGLGTYSSDEIINLLDRKELLKEKEEYRNLWIKLEQENSDIRVYENDTIVSHGFNYLDKKILEQLKQYEEISYYTFIGRCMANSICNFCSDVFFIARIEDMIKRKIIKITRTEQKKNITGKVKIERYISIN